MHGSVRSAGSTTHLSRGTAFAAGLFGKTGTKTSLGSPIPSLFPTSRRAVLSPPRMTRTTAMPASTSQTAPGPCLTPSSCPLTPQPIDRCPPRCQERAKLPGLPASTKMSRSPKGIVRKVWAWKWKRSGPRPCWSPASSAVCDQGMGTSSTDVRLTCSPAFLARGGCTSSTLLVQDAGRSFRMLLRYSSFKKCTRTHSLSQSVFRTSAITCFRPYSCMHFGTHALVYTDNVHLKRAQTLGGARSLLHDLFCITLPRKLGFQKGIQSH